MSSFAAADPAAAARALAAQHPVLPVRSARVSACALASPRPIPARTSNRPATCRETDRSDPSARRKRAESACRAGAAIVSLSHHRRIRIVAAEPDDGRYHKRLGPPRPSRCALISRSGPALHLVPRQAESVFGRSLLGAQQGGMLCSGVRARAGTVSQVRAAHQTVALVCGAYDIGKAHMPVGRTPKRERAGAAR